MQILSKSWKGESVLQLMQSDARGSLIIQGAGCMLWAYTWFMSYSDHCKKHILLGFPLNYLVFLIKSLIRKLESPRNAVFTFISLSYMLKNTRRFFKQSSWFSMQWSKVVSFYRLLITNDFSFKSNLSLTHMRNEEYPVGELGIASLPVMKDMACWFHYTWTFRFKF